MKFEEMDLNATEYATYVDFSLMVYLYYTLVDFYLHTLHITKVTSPSSLLLFCFFMRPCPMAFSLSTTPLYNSFVHLNNTKNQYRLSLSPPTLSLHQTNLLRCSHNLKLHSSSTTYHVPIPSATSSAGVESPVLGEDNTSSLDSVKVLDLNGNEVSISDLWKDRKAVVAFARHFGCVLCRKRADFLASKKDIMDASSVALVLIGPGNIDQARAFAEQTKFEGEIYADPTHSSYEALKFVSGVLTTFTPKAGLKIIQSYMEGYRQDWKLSSEKDTVTRGGWQQGGIIVAGPGKNNISYIHKDKEAGDDPDIEDILIACCS